MALLQIAERAARSAARPERGDAKGDDDEVGPLRKAGQEKPGLVDGSGRFATWAHLKDIDAEALSPAGSPASPGSSRPCRWSRHAAAWALRRQVGKFVAIGLNYVDHAKEVGMPIPRADLLPQGEHQPVRPQRPHRKSPRARPSSTGKSRSPSSSAPAPNTSAKPRRSTTSPAIASATTSPSAISSIERGGGQWTKGKSPDLRPARPVAGDHRRDRRRAEAVDVARRQRRAPADRLDRDHDLHRGQSSFPTSRSS